MKNVLFGLVLAVCIGVGKPAGATTFGDWLYAKSDVEFLKEADTTSFLDWKNGKTELGVATPFYKLSPTPKLTFRTSFNVLGDSSDGRYKDYGVSEELELAPLVRAAYNALPLTKDWTFLKYLSIGPGLAWYMQPGLKAGDRLGYGIQASVNVPLGAGPQ